MESTTDADDTSIYLIEAVSKSYNHLEHRNEVTTNLAAEHGWFYDEQLAKAAAAELNQTLRSHHEAYNEEQCRLRERRISDALRANVLNDHMRKYGFEVEDLPVPASYRAIDFQDYLHMVDHTMYRVIAVSEAQ